MAESGRSAFEAHPFALGFELLDELCVQFGAHPLMGLRIEARERFGERPIEQLPREGWRIDAELAGEYIDAAARVDIERYI